MAVVPFLRIWPSGILGGNTDLNKVRLEGAICGQGSTSGTGNYSDNLFHTGETVLPPGLPEGSGCA